MKRNKNNCVVTATFICENDFDAQRVISEVSALASERGCNLLFTDTDDAESHHIKAAEELGIFDDCQ